MSIQAISFGATTKNGNQYKKTNVGKYIGAALGMSAATIAVSEVNKMPKINVLRKFVSGRTEMINNGLTKIAANKAIRNLYRVGIVGGFITVGLIYTGLGAVADAFVNRYRANKADETAKKADKMAINA